LKVSQRANAGLVSDLPQIQSRRLPKQTMVVVITSISL